MVHFELTYLTRTGKKLRKDIRRRLCSETNRVKQLAWTEKTASYTKSRTNQEKVEKNRHTVTADGSTSTIEEELEECIKKVPKEEDDEEPFLPYQSVLCRRTSIHVTERRCLCFPGMWYTSTLCRGISYNVISVNQHPVHVLIAH